jgi:hypothetical protein
VNAAVWAENGARVRLEQIAAGSRLKVSQREIGPTRSGAEIFARKTVFRAIGATTAYFPLSKEVA